MHAAHYHLMPLNMAIPVFLTAAGDVTFLRVNKQAVSCVGVLSAFKLDVDTATYPAGW